MRRRIVIIATSVLAVIVVACAVGFLVFNAQVDKQFKEGFSAEAAGSLKALEKDESVSNMLVVITDEPVGQTDTDALSCVTLVRIDTAAPSVSFLAIPADTAVRLKSGDSATLRDIYASSGQAGAIDAVSLLTGLDINHYLESDLSGLCALVDDVGGIDVDIRDSFFDPEQGSFEAGTRTLDGASLRSYFLSSKAFSDGEVTRADNDTRVLVSLTETVSKFGFFERLGKLDMISGMISSDMSRADFKAFRKAFADTDIEDSASVISLPVRSGTLEGAPCSVMDTALSGEVIALFNGGQSVNTDLLNPTGVIVPSSYVIDVRNGVGIVGIASQATSRLQAAGFNVGEVGNANSFVYTETLIIYNDEGAASLAENVQTALRCGRTVENPGTYSFSGDILVIIGGDWIPE